MQTMPPHAAPDCRRHPRSNALFRICLILLSILLFGTPAQRPAEGAPSPPPKESPPGSPQPSQDRQYRDLFRRMFYSSTYNSLKCHENIYELLRRARENGLDLSGVRVIFIFDRDHDQLVPTRSIDGMTYGVQRPTITMYKTRIVYNRSDPPGEFRFHVFAALHDKIMDFDYTNRPKLVPAQTYFVDMYAGPDMNRKQRRELFQRLTLRVIPGEEYLNSTLQHTSWYLFDLETRFPSQTLDHFLSGLNREPDKKSETPPSD